MLGFNDIFSQLSGLKLAIYAPIGYILPSRLTKYEEIYDTQLEGGRGKLRQIDRERSLQALMTTNLLKRLESSVAAFRLTLQSLASNISTTIEKISDFEGTGNGDQFAGISEFDSEDEDLSGLDEFTVGKKVRIGLADMDLPSWKRDLASDLVIIEDMIKSMAKVGPSDDAKLQHLFALIRQKIDEPLNPKNRKILIFTAFADTANYLFDNLTTIADSLDCIWAK